MKSKKKILSILLLLPMLGACSNSSSSFSSTNSYTSSVEPSSEEKKVKVLEKEVLEESDLIFYMGRSEYNQDDNQRYFYYTGSGFEVQFIGTSLDITFHTKDITSSNSNPYFSLMIDEQIAPDGLEFFLSEETQVISLINNLPYGQHRVEVLKRSEPMDAITSISKIETDGTFKTINRENKMKIQLVGASGISGHGSLGSKGQGRTTKNSSSLHAFGYLTARMFDADFEFISNSGCGLKWGFRNSNVRQAYDYVGLDTKTNLVPRTWDSTQFEPDVVLVNIGGNDFNSYINNLSDQFQAKKEFRSAVKEFLTHIHELHPNAMVIWTHTGSNNGTEAKSAISDYGKNELVRVVEIPKVGADGDLEGANGHNGLKTHIRTADILAEAIQSYTDFEIKNSNILYQ